MGGSKFSSSSRVIQLVFGAVILWCSVVYGWEKDDTDVLDELSIGEETVSQEIRKLISILCGLVSTVLWMIVGFPQFYENYSLQTAEGLSIPFVVVWWSGDVLYLGGCYLTNQIPSVKLVGFWYLIMDTIFLWQIFYYDILKKSRFWPSYTSESQPLIQKEKLPPPTSNININNSYNSNNSREASSGSYGRWATSPPTLASPLSPSLGNNQPLSPTFSPPSSAHHPSPKRLFVILPLALFLIGAPAIHRFGGMESEVGVGGAVGGGMGTGRVLLEAVEEEEKKGNSILCLADTCDEGWQCTVGNALAWGSSALFLISRIPQIVKNFKRKSCEGLSMLMFTFAVLGNLTLAISIFIICVEPAYLEMEAPYLVGALGTLALDFTIFGQFLAYQNKGEYEKIGSKDGEA